MKRHLAMLVLLTSIAGLPACGREPSAATGPAGTEQNAVTEWASIVQSAIHNAAEPRSPASSEVLHTIAQLAVYDAVVAIEGNTAVAYQCRANPPPVGEFEPNGGCGTEPIDAKLAQVTPFTFQDPAQFRPDGPDPFTSDRWAEDFDEVKAYGAAASSVRTAEQTDVVYFWSEDAYGHWNRNLIGLAVARRLDVANTARLFATAHTAAAAIAGLEAKYFYRSWRPRTAIPRAGEDGNPETAPDPEWTPLLTVNHPEYPSAHGFFSTALTEAVAAFFGTHDVEWTIETSRDAVPQLIRTQRTYQNLRALNDEIGNARVWAGLHYRNSMREGAALGRRVADHVLDGHFHRDH